MGKYDTAAAPVMDIYDLTTNDLTQEEMILSQIKFVLNMIYANTSSLTGFLTYGTVYLIMLLRPRVLIVLNHV